MRIPAVRPSPWSRPAAPSLPAAPSPATRRFPTRSGCRPRSGTTPRRAAKATVELLDGELGALDADPIRGDERLPPAPEQPHVRAEELVGRADEVVAAPGVDVDRGHKFGVRVGRDRLSVLPGDPTCADGLDNDCDGETDEGVQLTFYGDSDGDGVGDACDVCPELADEVVADRPDLHALGLQRGAVPVAVRVVVQCRVDVEVVAPASEFKAIVPHLFGERSELVERQVGPLAGE